MEKVSAMKKIALFMMIVGLAVAMVACQGAVGKAGDKGEKGDKGDKGDTGAAGAPGAPAFVPLSAKAMAPSVVISDTTDEDGDDVAGAAVIIDLADYIYGTAERTYGTPTSEPATTLIFDVKRDGSILTITPKAEQPTNNQYNVETFMVKISDGGESTAITLTIPARRNQKPVAPDDDADSEGQVGTQAVEKPPETAPACGSADGNECYIDITFTDPSSDVSGVTEKLSFTATSSDTSKFVVVSVDNAVDDQDMTEPLIARVVVRGVASTWDADGDQVGHDSVDVVVVATDEGDATVRGKAQIDVDGEPTATTVPNGTVSPTQMTYTIGTVVGYFTDPEGVTLEYAAEVTGGDKNAVTATIVDNGTQFVVTRNAPGTAEVTITATEPEDIAGPEQSVKAVVTVTSS